METINRSETAEAAQARYIEYLRSDEADSVTILCDDPEADECEKQTAVECCGFWTGFVDKRFYGESVLQALARATIARQQLNGIYPDIDVEAATHADDAHRQQSYDDRLKIKTTAILSSGNIWDFADPENSKCELVDLALGISREGRYCNQTTPFYVVAEHSVHVSRMAEKRYPDRPQLWWDGLFHDSLEGILRDIARPQKCLLGDYKAMETRHERCVLPRFGVTYPLPPEIKELDMEAQLCEKAQIEPHRSFWDGAGLAPRPFAVRGLDSAAAFNWFMARVDELKDRGLPLVNF